VPSPATGASSLVALKPAVADHVLSLPDASALGADADLARGAFGSLDRTLDAFGDELSAYVSGLTRASLLGERVARDCALAASAPFQPIVPNLTCP
jgi:hypothetical protein